MKILLLGAVARVHGVEGEVQVFPFNSESERWWPGHELLVVSREAIGGRAIDAADVVEAESPERLVIETVRDGPKGRLIVGFRDVLGRAAAEALRGSGLGVDPESLGDPGPGAFWHWEVAGYRAEAPDGAHLGTVVRCIESYLALFEIRPERGGETWLAPVVPEIVLEVDRAGRRVVIDAPDGLIP